MSSGRCPGLRRAYTERRGFKHERMYLIRQCRAEVNYMNLGRGNFIAGSVQFQDITFLLMVYCLDSQLGHQRKAGKIRFRYYDHNGLRMNNPPKYEMFIS